MWVNGDICAWMHTSHDAVATVIRMEQGDRPSHVGQELPLEGECRADLISKPCPPNPGASEPLGAGPEPLGEEPIPPTSLPPPQMSHFPARQMVLVVFVSVDYLKVARPYSKYQGKRDETILMKTQRYS